MSLHFWGSVISALHPHPVQCREPVQGGRRDPAPGRCTLSGPPAFTPTAGAAGRIAGRPHSASKGTSSHPPQPPIDSPGLPSSWGLLTPNPSPLVLSWLVQCGLDWKLPSAASLLP